HGAVSHVFANARPGPMVVRRRHVRRRAPQPLLLPRYGGDLRSLEREGAAGANGGSDRDLGRQSLARIRALVVAAPEGNLLSIPFCGLRGIVRGVAPRLERAGP